MFSASTSDLAVPTEATHRPWRHQAPWLARLWRLTPLTLLVHAGDSAAESLLREGVLPLTARRAVDRALHRGAGPAFDAPQSAPAAAPTSARMAERVVCLDAAHDAPATRLCAALRAVQPALAQAFRPPLGTASAEAASLVADRSSRLLLLVEHFEQLLVPRSDDPAERQALIDSLVELARGAQAPGNVHLLLVLDERADTLLDPLRLRLPHLDEHRLRVATGAVPLESAPRIATAPTSAAEFRRSLDAALLRVTAFAQAAQPPLPDSALSVPGAAPSDEPVVAAAAHATAAASNADTAPVSIRVAVSNQAAAKLLAPNASAPTGLPLKGHRATAVAGAVLLTALGATWYWHFDGPRTVQGPPSLMVQGPAAGPPNDRAAPAAAASTVRMAGPVVRSTPPARPAIEPSADLKRLMSEAGLHLQQATGDEPWASAVRPQAPGLLLLRYDALQAALAQEPAPSKTSASAARGLRLLAPLHTEALWFLVRVDSPFKALHDIGRARINVGPVQGARALSAGRLWQTLFGRALLAEQADPAPVDEALAALAEGRIDVLFWVGAGPPAMLPVSAAASGLAGDGAEPSNAAFPAWRVLAVDEVEPVTRRLRQHYLPTTLPATVSAVARPTAGSPSRTATVPALALMNFLALQPGTGDGVALAVAQALCASLPALRRDAHPAWRVVQPWPPLPAGWPYADAAGLLRSCPSSVPQASAAAGADAVPRATVSDAPLPTAARVNNERNSR